MPAVLGLTLPLQPGAARVEQNATARQIQKAYRNASLTLHPDKNPSPTAADEFRRIANAYEVCRLAPAH